LVTSFKADANLYDLSRNPLWISKKDSTGKPYHKDIIVPASYREGKIEWKIKLGDHVSRADADPAPRAIALIDGQEIVGPVAGALGRIDVPAGEIAHPNQVIGDINADNPTLSHYEF